MHFFPQSIVLRVILSYLREKSTANTKKFDIIVEEGANMTIKRYVIVIYGIFKNEPRFFSTFIADNKKVLLGG